MTGFLQKNGIVGAVMTRAVDENWMGRFEPMVKINRRIAALAGVGAVTLLATPVSAQAVSRKRGAGSLDRLAEALGIDRAKLASAMATARAQDLQDRVAAGELSQQQADDLRERGQSRLPSRQGRRRGGQRRRGPRVALGGARQELHDATNAALANTLGYATVDELKQAKRGTFLVDLAADKGISSEQLEQAKRAAAQPILDRLVNEETLTRPQADQLLERLARVVTPSPTARAHQAVRRAMHEAFAKQLGYSNADELNKAVQDGVDPRALIEEKGLSREQLSVAQQDAAKAVLDSLVNAGTLTREQADTFLERGTRGFRSRRKPQRFGRSSMASASETATGSAVKYCQICAQVTPRTAAVCSRCGGTTFSDVPVRGTFGQF